MGAPQVDRAALVELDQLLIDKGRNRRSPIDTAIVQEDAMKITKVPVAKPVSRIPPGWAALFSYRYPARI